MAVAIPALMIAGSVAAVAGTAASAMAQYQSAQYNKKVDENNAQAALDQAGYANTLKQVQLEKTIGQERAAAGASGIVGGSSENVEYNSLVMGKLDQLATSYEGNVAANRNQSEAQLSGMQGANSLSGGAISGVGTALTGASKYYQYSSASEGVGMQPDFYGSGY